MNVCVAHLQMNACVAKNFGAWTEKVGHPCPTFMAHPTRVGRRVGALHKKLGHPCYNMKLFVLIRRIYNYLCDECTFVSTAIAWNLRFICFYCSFTALMMLYSEIHLS